MFWQYLNGWEVDAATWPALHHVIQQCMYLASVDEVATMACFLLFHEMMVSPSLNI